MPWGFSEMAVLHRCNGRRLLDSAHRHHSSVGGVHGTTESLQSVPFFEPIFAEPEYGSWNDFAMSIGTRAAKLKYTH